MANNYQQLLPRKYTCYFGRTPDNFLINKTNKLKKKFQWSEKRHLRKSSINDKSQSNKRIEGSLFNAFKSIYQKPAARIHR